MQKNRLTWMIGGPQGSGINASAEVFAKACSRAGLRVYANIEYHSNIMGKHSFYRVRVDDEDVRSYKDKADILVALDLETLAGDGDHRRWATHYGHLAEINDGGGVIFDSEIGYDPASANRPDLRFYPVPFMERSGSARRSRFASTRSISWRRSSAPSSRASAPRSAS